MVSIWFNLNSYFNNKSKNNIQKIKKIYLYTDNCVMVAKLQDDDNTCFYFFFQSIFE